MPSAPHCARGMAMAVSLSSLAATAGCETRDRLLFADPQGPGVGGPSTLIEVPAADTTVTAGPAFFITGLVTDATGIDTIYFDTDGGVSAFPPEIDAGTSFRFSLPLTTGGLAGDTIRLRVFATDRDGIRGDTATRSVAIE